VKRGRRPGGPQNGDNLALYKKSKEKRKKALALPLRSFGDRPKRTSERKHEKRTPIGQREEERRRAWPDSSS